MRTKKFLSLLLSAAMALSLLTATAFAAAPAEEENGFFDFLLGKKVHLPLRCPDLGRVLGKREGLCCRQHCRFCAAGQPRGARPWRI